MEGTSRIGPLVDNGPSHRFHDRLERRAQEHGLRRLFWLSLGVFVAGEGIVGFLAILFRAFRPTSS